MTTMQMFVYNNINTDARVQRCARAVKTQCNCQLLSIGPHWDDKSISNDTFVPQGKTNSMKYFSVFRQFIKHERKKKCAVFFAHDFSAALEAIYMKLTKKCKFLIYDAHELLYPEPNVPFSKRDYFFYFCEKWVIKHADLIICSQADRAAIMVKHYRLAKLPVVIRNISILPSCTHMQNKEAEAEYLDYFSFKSLTIVYAGAIEKERNLEGIIKAVSEYKGEPVRMLIVGAGSHLQSLKEWTTKNSLQNIKFMPSVPYNQLSFILSKCDIGYLSYTEDRANTRFCSPNKVFEYASVNLPIVSNGNETVKKLITSSNIGISDDRLDVALSDIIPRLSEMRVNCKAFLENNSWEKEQEKLVTAVKTILDLELAG